MGYPAPSVMIDLIEGVEDPLFSGLDECTADNVDTSLAP
jgi:ribose transport system substrate-binding protein